MKPEDVPNDLVETVPDNLWKLALAVDAKHQEEVGLSGNTWSGSVRAVLAAILPEHERQVRIKLSDEIYDMPHEGFNSTYDLGLDAAAEQVRGGQP